MNWREFFGFTSVQERSEESSDSEGGLRGLDSSYGYIGLEEQRAAPFGTLSYSELRTTYLKSSSVRPCVDSIARQIASLPWTVKEKRGGDPLHAAAVKEFFLDPNSNKESLRTILQKVLIDLLVIDSGIIEKAKSLSGNLLEIIARDGATFTPKIDQYGLLHGYKQRLRGDAVNFKNDEIVHLQLYPRTWDSYGTPIIETIRDEIATLMFSIAEIGSTFTRDEVPDGILALDQIGKDAYNRLKVDLTSEKGNLKKTLKVVRNVGKASWIGFKRPFREMQLAELNNQIADIVRRGFGIQDAEMHISPSAVLAITQAINYYFNREIVHDFFDDVYFKIHPIVIDEKQAKASEAKARALKHLASENILDQQELRRLVDEFLLPEEALD